MSYKSTVIETGQLVFLNFFKYNPNKDQLSLEDVHCLIDIISEDYNKPRITVESDLAENLKTFSWIIPQMVLNCETIIKH